MIHNKYFPPFLRGLNYSFMPVYSRKNRNLYLIDEKLWKTIHLKVSYIRAKKLFKVSAIKSFNFVYHMDDYLVRSLTPQHVIFLRSSKLLVSHINLNPLLNPQKVLAIHSNYFIHYFQRKNAIFHRHHKWLRFFKYKRIMRFIRLGFYRPTYQHYEDEDFDF